MKPDELIQIISILTPVLGTIVAASIALYLGNRRQLQSEEQRLSHETELARLQAKQQEKVTELAKIDSSTIQLLEIVSELHRVYHDEIAGYITAKGRDAQIAFSELLTKYYAWEQAIRPCSNESEHERILALRSTLTTVANSAAPAYNFSAQHLAEEFNNEVLDLVYLARANLDAP